MLFVLSDFFPEVLLVIAATRKHLFYPVFLLKLTPGQVLNKVLSHLGFMENAHISVAPLHSYSTCEKYHRFYIEVLFYKGFM